MKMPKISACFTPVVCLFLAVLFPPPFFNSVNAAPLPDTGVTACYDTSGNQIACPQPGQPYYGQDAQYGPGLKSFTGNGNGTVTDNDTGLMWEVKGVSPALNAATNTYQWQEAQDFINQLNTAHYAGYSDWRLPTTNELGYLIDHSISTAAQTPKVNTVYFSTCTCGNYWSSQPHAGDAAQAWYVNFNTGAKDYATKGSSFYVMAVRGGRR